ncbi:MAG: Gfo/Idh/MocA family oxidoreductase [Bryobacteraceae bacterium]|nr:Gfo/Idh/MocA family oxidoreductase [Bryobacteraceae bacterium]MDW8377001.1 Gfo/Idh/MocA family oxidoreductase [Bryobacterales bacterium]
MLVGCGYFSGIHLEAWARLRDRARITAVCDIDERAAKRRAVEYGIAGVYQNYLEMLDRETPDFVDIVTRPDLHGEIAKAAADRGIAVLCQKPIAPSWEEAIEIVNYCESRVRFMVNENWRWQAWYRQVKQLLTRGAIGKPFHFFFRHRVADGVGPQPYIRQPYFVTMPKLLLIETMIHFLDTARFLLGDLRVTACQLRRVNLAIQAEDVVVMLLEGEGGLVGVVDGNRLSPPEREGPVSGDLRIDGETGALSVEGDGRIFVRPVQGAAFEHHYAIPQTGYRGDSAYQTLKHFLDCLASGAEFETSGRDYLKTTRLVFDGYRLAGWTG